MFRAARAAACAVNLCESAHAVTDACWSRSPNASIAVTTKPARAADSAAARVETPARRTLAMLYQTLTITAAHAEHAEHAEKTLLCAHGERGDYCDALKDVSHLRQSRAAPALPLG